MRLHLVASIVIASSLLAQAQEISVHLRDQQAFEASQSLQPSTQVLPSDKGNPIDASPSPSLLAIQPRSVPGPCKTIFGYLPYWESAANIRWNLLTHLCCFSVEVNSSGAVTNTRGWPTSWTSTINAAHQNGVKVILCTTLFSDSGITALMGSTTAKNTFFANMKAQVLAGGADGLNVDFEGTSSGAWRPNFHTFLGELNTYMKANIPGCEVTFAGPAIATNLNKTGVAAACDGIFIMGYAYAGSFSSTTGANSPYNSMINVLDTQWGAVKNSTPQKLILGLPYYGHHWTTGTSNAPHAAATFISSTRFRDDATEAFLPGRELLWETTPSQSPWYRYLVGSTWHQVWYDDATSLGLKFSLADARNIQGVGMWALNYDGTRHELWDELNEHYGKPCQGPILPDFDNDGDVDMSDFGKFQACLKGPTIAAKLPDCWKAMLDADTDVDMNDYAKFEPCISGADHPASVTCLN